MVDGDLLEITGTRDPAFALDFVANQINLAFDDGDYAQTLRLLDQYVLEAWFGLGPEHLHRIIQTVITAGHPLPTVLDAVRAMMVSSASHADPRAAVAMESRLRSTAATPTSPGDLSSHSGAAAFVSNYGESFALRLQGRPVEALQASQAVVTQAARFQPLFSSHGGWGMFSTLQLGLTAMLAGDFVLAESLLTESKLHPTPPRLPFLSRDAHSKMALLHACFGDSAVAAAELELEGRVARTNSWIEPLIDAQTELARVLVEPISDDERVRRFDAIPLSALGEMWPFYAYAIRLIFSNGDQASEAVRRLEILDHTQLPRVEGQGLNGSVISGGLAMAALASGNLRRARELWDQSDPQLVLTSLGKGAHALASGDARVAVRAAIDARPTTRQFRKLEVLRLSLLASSLFTLGEHSECLDVLRQVLALPGGIRGEEMVLFHESVHAFARGNISEWPQVPAELTGVASLPLEHRAALTPRELEVLECLARGLTREQIGRELYLSVNTVKVHQQSLYRKLEVSSKNAAVFEGERRGLL